MLPSFSREEFHTNVVIVIKELVQVQVQGVFTSVMLAEVFIDYGNLLYSHQYFIK